MAKKNYTRELCIKIVQTDSHRRKKIEEMKRQREALTDTVQGMNVSDMPRSNAGGIGDPTSVLCQRLEYIDNFIVAEQERVNAVEEAFDNIGQQYGTKVQGEIKKALMLNLTSGGYLPFQALDYPFEREHFYKMRKELLRRIAVKLYLEPKI